MKRGFLYILLFTSLFMAEIFTLMHLAERTQNTEEVVFEEVTKETEEIEENEAQAVFPRTHDILINEFALEDAQLLMEVAQAEAGNQGEDGMWLVMSVICNRKDKEEFPNTIHDVVYQKSQFSTVSNGSINHVEISPECHYALARIEMGEVAPQIIGFETTDSQTLDAYFEEAFVYKDHTFYTLNQ